MSREPLLSSRSGNTNPLPTTTTNSSSSPAPVGPKLNVAVSEVTFDVRVPGSSGKLLSLPKDESEIPKLLEKQTTQEKAVDVTLNARVGVRGTKAADVDSATTAMNFSFRALLDEYSAMGDALEGGPEATRLALAQSFHQHVAQAMKKVDRRRDSTINLAKDFSSAERLLDQGVEGYTRAVRSVLKTGLDDSVRVWSRNMTFVSSRPIMGGMVVPYNTIGSVLYGAFIRPWIFLGRTCYNILSNAPAIQYETRNVLTDVTCLIEPGRLTLVLGPPGCGKTTFLKAVSGKLYGVGNPNAELKGELMFNHSVVKNLKNLSSWVSYVRQSDEHMPLLTTRETLEFAFKCRKRARYENDFLLKRVQQAGGPEAVEKIRQLKEVEVDIALAVLGLANCAETIIGNDILKGVSGGEKRRVTMGEMLVTGAQVMCCDEISTGLDSAATFDITKFLRSTAHVLGQNVIVALLQPAPEVMDLFDDLIVLAEGRIIYHGPREKVQEYFERLGFRIPANKDLGDFIVELPTRNGMEFQLSESELRELGLAKPPITPLEFATRWKNSDLHKQELRDLEKFASETQGAKNQLNFDDMPQNSFFQQMIYVTVWSMILKLRAKEQIVARLIANAVVGMFFGTLFWDLQLDDWWLKAMLFAMALMFLISTAFPAVQVTSAQKPIFFKHIDSNFYSPTVFCLSQFIVGIPFVAFDVAFFATTMYWMCGLARHADNFLVFLAVCVAFGICSNTMMCVFPFVTPDQDTAIVLAALVLILMIVASGAISTESMIPPLFRWALWVNPFAYAYRALAINEYHSGDYEFFPCKFEIVGIKLLVPDVCSHYFLSVREVRSEDKWVWIALVVQAGFTVFFLLSMIYAVAYIRFDVQRVGAVSSSKSRRGGKGNNKQRVVASEDEIRSDETERYLDAVSPRNMQALSISGGNVNNSLATGRGGVSSAAIQDRRQSAVQTPKKILVVRDLWYTIPINGEPIDFLKGVTFWAFPGRMTALMGSSGAGKTTLMDVIAGRKTVGYARGSIMVNDSPKIQSEFTKYTGYVEQFGVHANASTVEESLEFSAVLRLPATTTESDRKNYVRETLELLELDDIKDALAGTLSMEQNKRLTLGVELIANPSIIFCDEPTSGLDARAAAIVMRILLKVARSGRTVVCTIHQPSTAVFSFFDDLLLLKRGGQVVFFGDLGDGSVNLIKHLEAIPGTKKFIPGSNPATYMLDCIGAGTGADAQAEARRVKVDYATAYENSALKKMNDARLSREFPPIPSGYDPNPVIAAARASEEPTFVRGFWTQLYYLLKRNWIMYYRAPEFSLNRIGVIMLFTAVFAGFFWNSQMTTVGDVEGRIVLIFFFSSLSALYSLYTLVPFSMSRRALYYRERAAFTYSVAAYSWAEGLVELPYILVQIAITVPPLYWVTNLPTDDWERPLYFTLMIFMLLLLMTSTAFFMASMFSDPLAAQLGSIGFLLTMMVFCGIMVPRQNLPKPYIPMYYFSFFKYSSEGLLVTQFNDLVANICVPAGKPAVGGFISRFHVCTYDGSATISKISGIQISAAEFVLDDFAADYKYSNRWFDIAMLGVWIVVLRILTYIITLYVNHNRR